MADLNLDCEAPEQVADILESAADQYRQSACDLAAAWQEQSAGAVWNDLARILERAAVQCGKAVGHA